MADAAAEQEVAAGMARLLASEGPRAGWKVALNVAAVQTHFGLEGWLLGTVPEVGGPASGHRIAVPEGGRLKLEAELAVRLGAAGGAVSVDAVAPAFELVDYARPSDSLEAIVRHSFFHAAALLGTTRAAFEPLTPPAPRVKRNGEVVREAVEALRVDSLEPIRERAATLLAGHDVRLGAGEWILCGSLIDPVSVRPGDVFDVDFGPLGSLHLDVDQV